MSEPAILIVKPGTVRLVDMAALRKVGVIVVEAENPNDVRFIRAGTELSATALMGAAATAIGKSNLAVSAFGNEVCELLKKAAS